jgi:hypothetical protein
VTPIPVPRAIVAQFQVDLRPDLKAIGFDQAPGLAEFRQKMHATSDYAEVDVGHLLQSRQDAPQQPVIRPRTRDHGNAAAWTCHGRFCHGDASIMPCSMT